MDSPAAVTVYTIGHSTRTADEFLQILRRFEIRCVADVRTVPRSKRNPQFNREALAGTLSEAGIGYRHFPELGGFRNPQTDSPNTGWENASFRGYADYMQTEGFRNGLEQLLDTARRARTSVLCAEAVPWRCHRSLIADALMLGGTPVEDILDLEHSRPHRLTPFARWDGTRVTYPKPAADRPPDERDPLQPALFE